MYNRITFKYDGLIVEGILLAEFYCLVDFPEYVKKKFLFFSWRKKVIGKRRFKQYMVFVSWKHAMKDILFISEDLIVSVDYCKSTEWITIDRFISNFDREQPYHTEYIIENYKGYKFIFEDNEFIANVMQCLNEYSLDVLYKNIPDLINEVFDEDNATLYYPLFVKNVNTKEMGTGFIELQYCKKKILEKDALKLKNIMNWQDDSLYISVESMFLFESQYLYIFKSIKNKMFDSTDFEYFTLDEVKLIRDYILKQKPIEYQIIVEWLNVCIENGYSLYFLGL